VNRNAKLIKDGGCLVNLASSGHRFSDVDLNDPNFETTTYEPFVVYGRSKTANILFAVEFDRHRDRSGAPPPYILAASQPNSRHTGWCHRHGFIANAEQRWQQVSRLEFKSIPQVPRDFGLGGSGCIC
jgi:hypothetical protein